MAFVCVLLPDEDHFRVFREVNATGSAHMARTVIGYDDIEPILYYAVVMLDPLPGEDRLELRFWIEDFDSETEAFYPRWSGKETRFIQKEYRPRVLVAILNLAQSLITSVKPPSITMVSNDSEVQKSQAKHILIANMCQGLGYKIRAFDHYHGRKVWCMDIQSAT